MLAEYPDDLNVRRGCKIQVRVLSPFGLDIC